MSKRSQVSELRTLLHFFMDLHRSGRLVVCISRCGPALEPVLSVDMASSHIHPRMTNKHGLYHSWAAYPPPLCNFGRLSGDKVDRVLSWLVQQDIRVILKGRETSCVGHDLYF